MAENTPLTKDWFLMGIVTGMALTVAKSLVNVALDRAGVPTVQHGALAGSMLLGKKATFGGLVPNPPETAGEKVLGHLADTISGGAIGAGISYIYAKSAAGNEILKGGLSGAALGMITLAAGNRMNLSGFRRLRPAQVATIVGLDAIFGALQGAIYGRYSSQMVTESHPIPVKPVSNHGFEAGRLRLAGRVAGRDVWRSPAAPASAPPGPASGTAILDLGISPTIL